MNDTARGNRRTLIIIALLFLGSFALAAVMRFADLHPQASKQKGELLEPYGDLRAIAPNLADGTRYDWNPAARTWRILVPAPAACADDCVRIARDVEKVWQLFNREANRVDVLWACDSAPCAWPAGVARPATLRLLAPDPRLRAELPRSTVDGIPVYVVDPNGFVILRYAPGMDLGAVRTDLARLLKLR